MKIAIAMAGFSPGEADELRRAIGAWRSSGEIDRLGRKLFEGLIAGGLPKDYAERIFQQIQGFAEYGFPESHAASFALLAYASSYFKCHHPAEFTCALINAQPMGFYSTHTLVDDAKRHGVRVLPVHPNISDWNCRIDEQGVLRLGWCVANGLSQTEAEAIIQERTQRPFTSLRNFMARVRIRQNVLHSLVMGDAFACFGVDQRHALWDVLEYELSSKPEAAGQLNLFSNAPSFSQTGLFQPALFKPMDDLENIQADYGSFNLSARGHPMRAIRARLPHLPRTTSIQAKETPAGRSSSIAGIIIVRQRPPTAKGVTFATLEDEHGFLDLVFHREIFEKYEELFWNQSLLIAHGKIQRDGNSVSMLVREIRAQG